MELTPILGLLLIVCGALTVLVAVLKPSSIWQIGQIQGVVQLLTERGTVIFFSVVGLAAVAGGLLIIF